MGGRSFPLLIVPLQPDCKTKYHKYQTTMTGNLAAPDPTRPCRPFKPYYLTRDTLLCRIYNRREAIAGGYSCLSWNPTISSGQNGGRFDAWSMDKFDYLYGAEADAGCDVAIIETILPLASYNPAQGRDVIPRGELDVRAVQWFSCADDIVLASLLDVEARTRLNAPEEVCYSGDRNLTRQWGTYFRSNTRLPAAGLAYNSTVETIDTGLHSFVLWGDRAPGLAFIPRGPEVGFETKAGRNLMQAVLDKHDILIY